jgi:hypothetical protein
MDVVKDAPPRSAGAVPTEAVLPKADEPAKPPHVIPTQAGQPIPTQAAPAAARVVFSRSPCSETGVQLDAEFSVSDVRELFVCTFWSGLAGEHTELRKFHAPGGEIYYQKLIAFSTSAAGPVPFTRAVDVPHEEMVRPLEVDADGELVVGDYIALAGAWIGDHGMIGPWQLEAFLDGEKVPSVSASFELVP